MNTVININISYFVQVNGSVNNIIVTGLSGHTTYSCTIFGYSQVTGPISDPLSVITLQGGTYITSYNCIL